MLNLARIQEAIAEKIPKRDALIFRDRRLSWRELNDRTRRLAAVFHDYEMGCRVERSKLENWQSGQDHVALYLHNGNEYLEGMLGCFKARAAPFNVNYRYIDQELVYLLNDADTRAVIFHACFAPTLMRIRDQLPKLELWLQVADESCEALMPGALDYEAALASVQPRHSSENLSPDDLYILYTGGTTGMPKGVLWRQEDIFLSALYSRAADSLTCVVERAVRGDERALTAAPFMHGAAHWVAFNIWHAGGTVIVPSNVQRLDPSDIWATVERERVTTLAIVGDAFGRPLVDELRDRNYDVSSLRQLTSGGAILSAAVKQEFLELIPNLRIRDALGSSEAGTQANRFFSKDDHSASDDFTMRPDNVVLSGDLSTVVASGSGELGWLARCGRVPLGYYKDPEKSAETFPIIDGTRYAVPGDRALAHADGTMTLLGRDSVTINTGGEKVFAEEVEHALKNHSAVYDVVVVPTPHERWGQQVTALVRLRDGASATAEELRAAAREQVASYKLPRVFIFVDEIVRSPSGKADYRWAKKRALEEI